MARNKPGLHRGLADIFRTQVDDPALLDPWLKTRSINYPGGEKAWKAFLKENGRGPQTQAELDEFISRHPELREEETPWYVEADLNELKKHFGLDFDMVSPVMSGDHESSRVASMMFKEDKNTLFDLRDAARRGETKKTVGDYINGEIYVTWQNGKPSWKYKKVTYSDYMDFKDSPSKGKHLNSNLRTNHGPADDDE